MKVSSINSTDITSYYRLDSLFYLSEGNTAIRLVNNALKNGALPLHLDDEKVATIWQPKRNVLVYAGEKEEYIPYLQPYDILEYLPSERARLSVHQNDLKELRVSSGTILQTCSGRNLGPLVIADPYLEQFVFGSDLIRITIPDLTLRYYIFAFLSTWVGQALLHSNKTGSVIDHLSTKSVEEIVVPLFEEKTIQLVSSLIERSFNLLSSARLELDNCKKEFTALIKTNKEYTHLRNGWSVSLKKLSMTNRIDAAYYDPTVLDAAERLKANGGCKLKTIARVFKPGGRYKTNYVKREHGIPLLSGRQLLQNQIVGAKYLSKTSLQNQDLFSLKTGYIAYPADGRVEGRLGTPILITNNRNNWLASVHVGRVIPNEGTHPGYMYLALSHPVVQSQLSALACGSVVDSVYPEDVEDIIVPKQVDFNYDRVVNAWEKFDTADLLKEEACKIIVERLISN